MKRFEVGKRYWAFSPCDQSCTWEYEVIKRTDKMITLLPIEDDRIPAESRERIKRVKILTDDAEEEWARPLGKYSMCPMLRAGRTL
jgi:hypothetical protein